MKFRLVTLDLTDTVFRFKRPPFIVYKEAAERRGLMDVSSEALKRGFFTSWKAMNRDRPNFGDDSKHWWIDLVYKTFKEAKVQDDQRLTEIVDDLYEVFSSPTPYEVFPDARRFIENRRGDFVLGALTNFDKRIFNLVRELQLDFDFITCSETAGASKPDEEIFKAAIKNAKMNENDKATFLHIGDSYEKDFCGAKSAGWNAILLSRSSDDPCRQKLSKDEICDDFDQVTNTIFSK